MKENIRDHTISKCSFCSLVEPIVEPKVEPKVEPVEEKQELAWKGLERTKAGSKATKDGSPMSDSSDESLPVVCLDSSDDEGKNDPKVNISVPSSSPSMTTAHETFCPSTSNEHDKDASTKL